MTLHAVMTYGGIAIAAQTRAVCIATPAAAPSPPALTLPNTTAGWERLIAAVASAGGQPTTTLLVMEATGADWQGIATALQTAGWTVSAISPGSARAFARPDAPRQDRCGRCRAPGRLRAGDAPRLLVAAPG